MSTLHGDKRNNAVKPQGGDNVYHRDDEKRTSMYLERTYMKDRVAYGTCSWKIYEMFDDELMETEMQKDFLMSELVLIVYTPRQG